MIANWHKKEWLKSDNMHTHNVMCGLCVNEKPRLTYGLDTTMLPT